MAENQIEVSVFTYLFITKAKQGCIFQSVPNWALIRGQKEKDSAVKCARQEWIGWENRVMKVFIDTVSYHPWCNSESSHICGGSHALLYPGWHCCFRSGDSTVHNLLLFLQKPSQNKSFPKSPKYLQVAALYHQSAPISSNTQGQDKSLIPLTFRCAITLAL